MPRGDGSGPEGMGPMTGRAAGFCAGFGMPGYMNPMPGRGLGCGGGRRGRGRGWRNHYHATGMPGWMRAEQLGMPTLPSPEDEKESLEHQLEYLQAQVEKIRKRLDEIAAAKKKGKRS